MGARKRSFNIGLIRQGANYTLQEIATLYKLHIRSVREWIKAGLKIIDRHKPYLVHGSDLYDFLKQKQEKRKSKCKKDQLYCCSCRTARESICNEINIKILNHKLLMMTGCCSSCKNTINQLRSTKSLEDLKRTFNVKQIHDQRL